MDITDLILHDHDEQRRGFALLDDISPGSEDHLAAVWSRLQVLLEVHAKAEELFFYPRLLEVGSGPAGDGPQGEVKDAIKDHNEIRDAVRDVAGHTPGSQPWWTAVRKARDANSDHMAEEERGDLADFRRHATLQQRHDIAVAFVVYESRHAGSISPSDKDPQGYVQANT